MRNTNSQAFGKLKPIAPGRPRMAFIGVTERCNTRCRHCPHYHYTFGTDMSEAVMRKVIDALAEGLELIAPQGVGEPLIAKPFYLLLGACERSGVRMGFATNAILLNDALVRRLVPVDIGVSIDGARPETYHFVRPLQDWDRLLEALALAQRCRQEAGPECRGSLSLVCVAISGGPPEPFDLSCEHLFFPVDHVSADSLDVRFEKEGLSAGELVI